MPLMRHYATFLSLAAIAAAAFRPPGCLPDAIVDFEVQLAPGRAWPWKLSPSSVYRKWAPLVAIGFLKLTFADGHFFGCAFFRVINRFMAQFGINAAPRARDGGGERSKMRCSLRTQYAPRSTRAGWRARRSLPNSRRHQYRLSVEEPGGGCSLAPGPRGTRPARLGC